MLRTRSLRFTYPDGPALAWPDLAVEAGGALLVLGESGCGKSTLLQLLAGLRTPDAGQVTLDGTDLAGLSPAARDALRGRRIGLVHQRPPFVAAWTLRDNLLASPFARDARARERLETVAERLGIAPLLDRLPGRLSAGERQRAALARALLTGPDGPALLLADEPTSALDHRRCDAVVDLLTERAREAGAALVVVTHDERVARSFPDRLDLQPVLP
jgi:putative ABC transport system ATP-binding protein